MIEEDKIIILHQSDNQQTAFFQKIADSALKEKYEFISVTTGMEAVQLLSQFGSGCLLFSVGNRPEMKELAIILKRLKKDIRNNLFKVAGYNNIPNNKKVVKFLKDHHVTEIFEGTITNKAIDFKFNLWFKSITAARKKFQVSSDESFSINKNSKNKIETKLKSSTAVKNPIKFLAPLELHSDCWILPNKNRAKNIMNSWTIELIGPGPAAGHWQDITKTTNSTTPIWKWIPTREDLFTFILEDGAWIFRGREPFFNWETNLWKFSGDTPELLFYTDKPVAKKFYIENNQLHITKTSDQAQAKLAMLKESFDPKYNLGKSDNQQDDNSTSSTDKINKFYKGQQQSSADQLDNKNIHKSQGFKEKSADQLTGEGQVEHLTAQNSHQRNSQASLDIQTPKPQKANANLDLASNKKEAPQNKKVDHSANKNKDHSSTNLNLPTQKQKSATGFQEQQQKNMSGRGGVKEELDNISTQRERTKSPEISSTNKHRDHTQLADEELEQLQAELEQELEQLADEMTEEMSQEVLAKPSKSPTKRPNAKTPDVSTATTNSDSPLNPSKHQTTRANKAPKAADSTDNNSLDSILDAPVDIGMMPPAEEQEQTTSSSATQEERTTATPPPKLTDIADQPSSRTRTDHSAEHTPGQFAQHNDAIKDEHGDFNKTDKEWEKYYRGGKAKKDKKAQEGHWDGPSGNRNEFNQRGSGHFGQQGNNNSSSQGGPLSGTIDQNALNGQEREEKKKAFDAYMASLRPKEERERPQYEHIGNSQINMNNIELELTLKTQSTPGQLFDIEEETELLDIVDNIIVLKNLNRSMYALHTPMLLHCNVYYASKEYDFTLTGRLLEIEGEEQEILNLELTKFNQEDLDNLFLLFTERQQHITNFIYTAQGRA